MNNNKKINQSEKSHLEDLQAELNDNILSYGQQKYIVEDIKDQLDKEKQKAVEIKQNISELQEKYDSYVQDLYQKYGDVAIDLDSGNILDPDNF
jgi:chromosome segregation ATPase